MARVFIDTNVLFPFSLMDLNLSLAADYVHDLVWSERLLAEWQRVIVREGHRAPEAAERIAAHNRTGFADACVPEDRYKHLLADLAGPDSDDLHHIAAAIAGSADTLITWNLADFPADILGAHGITATPPDPYLCTLLDQQTTEVLATIRRIAARKKHPPLTPLDVLTAIGNAGAPAFSHRARQLLLDPAA